MNQHTDEYLIVEEGDYIAFSTGSYSDYCVNGLYRALKSFCLKDYAKYGLPDREEADKLIAESLAQAQTTLEYSRKHFREGGRHAHLYQEAIKRSEETIAAKGLTPRNLKAFLRWQESRFAASLVRLGLIEEVEYREFNLDPGYSEEWLKDYEYGFQEDKP